MLQWGLDRHPLASASVADIIDYIQRFVDYQDRVARNPINDILESFARSWEIIPSVFRQSTSASTVLGRVLEYIKMVFCHSLTFLFLSLSILIQVDILFP